MAVIQSASTLWALISVTVSPDTRAMVIHAEVSGCDPNAKCINTLGSYKCDCKPCYQGDGYIHVGVSSHYYMETNRGKQIERGTLQFTSVASWSL